MKQEPDKNICFWVMSQDCCRIFFNHSVLILKQNNNKTAQVSCISRTGMLSGINHYAKGRNFNEVSQQYLAREIYIYFTDVSRCWVRVFWPLNCFFATETALSTAWLLAAGMCKHFFSSSTRKLTRKLSFKAFYAFYASILWSMLTKYDKLLNNSETLLKLRLKDKGEKRRSIRPVLYEKKENLTGPVMHRVKQCRVKCVSVHWKAWDINVTKQVWLNPTETD